MIEIREPKEADAQTLAALADELNVHEGDPRGHFTAEKALSDVIEPGAPLRALLAEMDGRAVGYAMWHFAYESAWAARGVYLSDLYVREEGRGAGVADALMRAVAKAAHAEGGTYVWLTAQRRNARARAFYRKLGDEEDGITAYAITHERFGTLLE